MSSLQVIGALAQGYTEAAKQRREQNLALGEHQRDLQLNLLDKLLADPSTPEEYKGAILQHRIATTNANQYDKNGILKLPSLDDMRQSLPPVQRPQPNPVQAPAIAMPSAPPTGSAAMPPSGVQKPAGSSPVPLQLPTPPQGPPSASAIGANGPSLPATPIALPTPPPIAEAGQFHPLTQQEQIQRQTQLALSHAQQLITNGVPPAQAYVAAGLMPKPELHNIPFLGTAVNPYTMQTVGPQQGAERPKGVPQVFQTPDGLATLQQVQTNDGKYHWEDLQGNAVVPQPGWVKLVPAMLPTQHTSNTSDEFGTKSTTTSTSQKVVPGQTRKVGGAATPKNDDGLTPAQRRANFQNEQAAVKQVQKDAVKASADTRAMVNLLDTQTDYMNGIGKGEQPTPRQDLSLIVAAVRAMNPGTVRLPTKELELELRAGSYGDRFRRQWDIATNGTLPADQRTDLFNVVKNETTKAASSAAANWKQSMGKQPLPSHLQRFATTVNTPTPPPTGQVVVVDPQGGKHTFPDQKSADTFKQLAHIN